MYVEMDVELLAPDIEHSIGVNEYAQNRNMLSYKFLGNVNVIPPLFFSTFK
jgi:hypothetical protein